MPYNKNQSRFNNQYSTLGTADEDELSIKTDNQSYHEIKVYNGTRDNMWLLLSDLTLSTDIVEVLAFANQEYLILKRADSIWAGIKASAMLKAQKLKAGQTKSFEYKGEFKKIGDRLKKYIDFYQYPDKFEDEYNQVDKEFSEFKNNKPKGQLEYLKNKFSDVITDADQTWGALAARIGFGMPLQISEERNIFFRGR